MDHQLDMLKQKTLAQSTSGKSSSHPAATSTRRNTSHQDQSWLQQADLDVADAFLNQLDNTPAKRYCSNNQVTDKSSKSSKKCKLMQPWFMMSEQKWQHLDIFEVSSDQLSDEPLGESSVTSSSDSDSSAKKSRQHRRSKKHKLKSRMFAKHTSTIKKPQLWPHNHLDPHFVSHMPKFQDISWDQLVAIILQAKFHTQAMGRLHLLKQLAYWKLHSGNLYKVQQLYIAMVRTLEEGESSWSSNFQLLEVLVMGDQPKAVHKPSKPILMPIQNLKKARKCCSAKSTN